MQVQSIHTILPQEGVAGSQGVLADFSPGDVIQAEVTEADQGQATLRLQQGDLIKATQRTMDPLEPGDVVLLQVGQNDAQQSVPRLELLCVNGQPIQTGASLEEYALLRMQVAPSRTNLIIASALAQIGAPAKPETFARMAELTAGFPALEADAALLLAASALPLNESTVRAFSQWLMQPLQTADLSAAVEKLVVQHPQTSPVLADATRQMVDVGTRVESLPVQDTIRGALPRDLSPALSTKLAQSEVWQEIQARLPALPEMDANGLVEQFMENLPKETSDAERSLLFHALESLRDAPPQSPAETIQPLQQPIAKAVAHTFTKSVQTMVAPEPGEHPEVVQAAPLPRPAQQNGLHSLFAAILERPAAERGQALKEATVDLAAKLHAFTSVLQAQDDEQAARLKPVLELGQALTTQVQMGGELGNLLYLSLPITLHENQQDASLYVLKRNGGAGKVDESNVTVAICLETQNLGPVDTLLRVERNEIALQFRVDSPQARAFMQTG
ncbi:MAG: hypothetical protein EOM66_09065, partial [Clostridia bacterium]|nr:hypothetical protein [Clostridia bacterium]